MSVDLFRTPLTAEQIRAIAGEQPVSELVAWRSPQARARGLQPAAVSDEELLGFMAAEPRLIRRPLVRVGGTLVVGADLEAIRTLLRRAASAQQ